MARLNPSKEPRIRFEAFAGGLQSWLSEHGAGLPSPVHVKSLGPVTSSDKENSVPFKVSSKEHVGRGPCQPLQLQTLAASQYPTNSPSKDSLRRASSKP